MQEHYYKFWRDLIKPKAFEVDRDVLREDYGRFMIRPLERGYGVTLGNSLRRILLSSMMGSAVSAVKFDGVLHEFSTLPDVMEDVTDTKRAAEIEQKAKTDRLRELEQVRKRIAADLHDDIGSSLTQISIFSEVLQQRVDKSNERVLEPLEFIAASSRELVEAVSDIVWAINPQKDFLGELPYKK